MHKTSWVIWCNELYDFKYDVAIYVYDVVLCDFKWIMIDEMKWEMFMRLWIILMRYAYVNELVA